MNALNQKVIDMSQADIVLVKTSETSRESFEKFLRHVDINSEYQKMLRSDKMHLLQELERNLTWKKHEEKVDKLYNEAKPFN